MESNWQQNVPLIGHVGDGVGAIASLTVTYPMTVTFEPQGQTKVGGLALIPSPGELMSNQAFFDSGGASFPYGLPVYPGTIENVLMVDEQR